MLVPQPLFTERLAAGQGAEVPSLYLSCLQQEHLQLGCRAVQRHSQLGEPPAAEGMPGNAVWPTRGTRTGTSPELSLEQEGRRLSCCSQQSQITASSPLETHLPDQWGFALKNPNEMCGMWIPHLHALKCTCRGGDCGPVLVWTGSPEQSLSQTC